MKSFVVALLGAVLGLAAYGNQCQAGGYGSFAQVCDHDVVRVELVEQDYVVRQFRNQHGDLVQEFASGRVRVIEERRVVVRKQQRVPRRISSRNVPQSRRVFLGRSSRTRVRSSSGALVNSNAQFGLLNINIQ
jgi:hypothetical protein